MTGPPVVMVDPIVMPPNVTVTAALATTLPDPSVSTMLDVPLAPQLAVAPPLRATLLGVTLGARKPDGYVSVTVLGDASAPPAVVVKLNVTGTPALLIARSRLAIANPTEVTALPMCPDCAPLGEVRSRLVITVTKPPAVAVVPIVMPPNVTVTAVLAATLPVSSVSTMLDAPLATELAVAPPLNATLLGVTLGARKPDGYVSVIVSGDSRAPAIDVVKPNVTSTPALFTTRSELRIENSPTVTAPPMYPDGVLADVNGS